MVEQAAHNGQVAGSNPAGPTAPHGHGHRHDHGHHHSHGHGHAPKDFGAAFAIGIALNLGFVGVEAGYGIAAGSMALLADAGHNLSDVLGLVLAWTAHALARRRPSARFTYGWRRSSILAALFNALFLLLACGGIVTEAVRRFAAPAPVAGATVMIVAAIGIAVNLATALMFARGGRDDINIRGAFLHMAADAGVSAAVVLAGLATLATGRTWIDPAASLAVVAVILIGTWGLLRDAATLALDGVPPGIDMAEVEQALGAAPGVSGVHHVHIWAMSTTETALTAHLLVAGPAPAGLLGGVAAMLRERFGIVHTTLQVEPAGAGMECPTPIAG